VAGSHHRRTHEDSEEGEDTAVLEAVGAVGIDLGDRWSHWCALSSTGEVIDGGRVKTTAEALS
jgi:hypothetical protein